MLKVGYADMAMTFVGCDESKILKVTRKISLPMSSTVVEVDIVSDRC